MSESTTIVRTRVPGRRLQRYAGADASLRSEATTRQVSGLERELDLLVSALHGLTPEEIQLVGVAQK